MAKKLVRLNINPKLVIVKDVQCYELFGGIALKNHEFSFFFIWIIISFAIENSLFSSKVCYLENDIFLQAYHKDAFCLLFFSHYIQMTAQELKTLSLYSDDTVIVDLSNSIPHYIEVV